VAAALLAAPHGAFAADGIKAAYVETVIPSKSYSGQVYVSNSTTLATLGPPQPGVLGVGTLLLTNTDDFVSFVIIGVPELGGAACGANSFTGYIGQPFYVYVAPRSTLAIPFPTPYVINPAGGQACIAVQGGGFVDLYAGVQVVVTGFLN
jgi:hypothetical protein